MKQLLINSIIGGALPSEAKSDIRTITTVTLVLISFLILASAS